MEKRLYNMGIVFMDARMLVSIVKQFITSPRSFDEYIKATFFKAMVQYAHRRRLPLKIFKSRRYLQEVIKV